MSQLQFPRLSRFRCPTAYPFQGYNDDESEIDQNIVKQLEELNNDDWKVLYFIANYKYLKIFIFSKFVSFILFYDSYRNIISWTTFYSQYD